MKRKSIGNKLSFFKELSLKKLVSSQAQKHGFIDPIEILARLEKFAQPCEIKEPIELLRAGAVFHARGLMNTKAIQHNLDWVWPYWVNRQFDPGDPAFLPRAFSITHVNLTHRNWTAVGIPDCQALPIVDPCGLVTPFFDSWSIDSWIITDKAQMIIPSRGIPEFQKLIMDDGRLAIHTKIRGQTMALHSTVDVTCENGEPGCRIRLEAETSAPSWLIVSLRPFNPEGVSLVNSINFDPDASTWIINNQPCIHFLSPVEQHKVSDYRGGDVYSNLLRRKDSFSVKCPVGMATAAAMYRIEPNEPRKIDVVTALKYDQTSQPIFPFSGNPTSWHDALNGICRLSMPNKEIQYLYDAALRTVLLHSPKDVYPGPYTYKRYWFRDTCFIAHAMLCSGMVTRVERVLDDFRSRQTHKGYFHSQEGEWDSNGEVLWIINQFCQMTGRMAKQDWYKSIVKAGEWIVEKRLPDSLNELHSGLLPAGFSAEHLGPNDYYYWDNFWAIAGLQGAATMLDVLGDNPNSKRFRKAAGQLNEAVERSLTNSYSVREFDGFPASPYRRMDPGAIGSIVAGYPLKLLGENDKKLLNTVDYLLENGFIDGAFFHDITHSGFNAYLTLHVAQALLRAGDPQFHNLIQAIVELASPTGQWPEAIHPHTRGGCMGDGQHVWAAAEWILMVRNCFVREEANRLILTSGVVDEWLNDLQEIRFGPAPTEFGTIDISIKPSLRKIIVQWNLRVHGAPPRIEVRLPEYSPKIIDDVQTSRVEIDRINR